MATGLVDPYFHELAEALREGTKDPPRSEGTLAIVKDLLGAMSSAGTAYARTGNPYGEGQMPEGIAARENMDPLARAARENPGGASAQQYEQLQMAARLREFADGRFGEGLVAHVELRQQKDGTVVEAKLVKPSGSATFDRHVLANAPEAATKHGPLPDSGLGILESGARSLWAFEARLIFSKEPTKPGGGTLGADDLFQSLVVGALTGAGGMATGTFGDDGSLSIASLGAPRYRVRVRLIRIYDD